jgi:serine/threonine-protein kinase
MPDSTSIPAVPPAPAQTLEEFLRVARASGLVDSDQLDQAIAPWKAVTGPVPEDCFQALRDRGLLTTWQIEQLRRGRHKGFVLGKYKLLRLLGSGGMSSVYLAEHATLHNKVAIKVLPVKRVTKTSYLARFEREAQSSARLNHPHLARAFDLDSSGAIHFIVMEYIDGTDLHARVKKDGPLPVREAADFIRQAALGLHYAHEEGLVHRDIKPANLMVDKRGHIKILDLGLALANDDEDGSLTKEHDEKVLGTADYLAPEQARNSHLADRRSDIYSLGCTLYYLLVGRAPFAKGSLAERIRGHMNEPAPNPLDVRPDVPNAIVELYFRMMEKHPDARQQTAQEVADSLAVWLSTAEAETGTGRPRAEPPNRSSLRRTTGNTAGAGDPVRPTTGLSDQRRAIAPPSPVTLRGPGSSVSGGSVSGLGSGSGLRSAVDLHSLSLTPPPSAIARVPQRLPAVFPPMTPRAGRPGGTPPTPVSKASTPAEPSAKPVASGGNWLWRRRAGLPLVAWLVGGFLLAWAIAVTAWLLLGHNARQNGGGPTNTTVTMGDHRGRLPFSRQPA